MGLRNLLMNRWSASTSGLILEYAFRARQGYWVGPLSTGYCNGLCSTCTDECPRAGEDDVGDGRTAVPHPRDSEAIRLAFQMYSTGNHSYRTILQELNSQGYATNRKEGRRRWTKEALKHTLANPFYIGKVRYKGKVNQGRHEPLVDKELFNRCQEVKRLHGRSPRTYVAKFRTYTFSGVLCTALGAVSECEQTTPQVTSTVDELLAAGGLIARLRGAGSAATGLNARWVTLSGVLGFRLPGRTELPNCTGQRTSEIGSWASRRGCARSSADSRPPIMRSKSVRSNTGQRKRGPRGS
jgi:hypothetical protein